ncbi:DUF2946 family protein [Rivihabitans pingtungensis]|uniref:DUF2946 family protein n=1 Tax=Rivihabitans pingtungensis TaxID=1054498 RepID=UPI0023536362|nr:DUF2946 family protein [Rivihabitans pingtungensis]MCK6438145.1 DUF2946 family protein [Rivihabitans pingtungensis]
MDDSVLAAMAKWPNVPEVFGWLSLDARGQWRLRGEPLNHPAMLAFIQRNYTCDRQGRAYFQNGPQRVYVTLEAAPYIARFRQGSWQLHDGEPVHWIGGAFLTPDGSLFIDANRGKLAGVDDHDLDAVLALLRTRQGQPLDEAGWAHWLAGEVEYFLHSPPQPPVRLEQTGLDALHERFRIQPNPQADQ